MCYLLKWLRHVGIDALPNEWLMDVWIDVLPVEMVNAYVDSYDNC